VSYVFLEGKLHYVVLAFVEHIVGLTPPKKKVVEYTINLHGDLYRIRTNQISNLYVLLYNSNDANCSHWLSNPIVNLYSLDSISSTLSN
jgi:hypothetical protein